LVLPCTPTARRVSRRLRHFCRGSHGRRYRATRCSRNPLICLSMPPRRVRAYTSPVIIASISLPRQRCPFASRRTVGSVQLHWRRQCWPWPCHPLFLDFVEKPCMKAACQHPFDAITAPEDPMLLDISFLYIDDIVPGTPHKHASRFVRTNPEADPSSWQANSSAANRSCCGGLDHGPGECCAGRLQGRGDTVKDCPTIRPISIGCAQGSLI
jgi:hypothetical protein